jgi:hypothetical protein
MRQTKKVWFEVLLRDKQVIHDKVVQNTCHVLAGGMGKPLEEAWLQR